VDRLWHELSEGGQEVQCGWLTDKFGVSWQIVPTALPDMLSSADTAAAQRAFTAMLGMKKLDISALQRAYESARSRYPFSQAAFRTQAAVWDSAQKTAMQKRRSRLD